MCPALRRRGPCEGRDPSLSDLPLRDSRVTGSVSTCLCPFCFSSSLLPCTPTSGSSHVGLVAFGDVRDPSGCWALSALGVEDSHQSGSWSHSVALDHTCAPPSVPLSVPRVRVRATHTHLQGRKGGRTASSQLIWNAGHPRPEPLPRLRALIHLVLVTLGLQRPVRSEIWGDDDVKPLHPGWSPRCLEASLPTS